MWQSMANELDPFLREKWFHCSVGKSVFQNGSMSFQNRLTAPIFTSDSTAVAGLRIEMSFSTTVILTDHPSAAKVPFSLHAGQVEMSVSI
jgi:hypothetical protein